MSIVALAAAGAAVAPNVLAEPDRERAIRALEHDLEKIVENQETTGWKIDRYEYDSMMPDALESVCLATVETRRATLARLDAKVAALGGSAEIQFRRRGGDLDAVEDLLFATRVRDLLAEAMRRAPRECPFWVTPTDAFRGRQSGAYRFAITGEGGGLLTLYSENDGVQSLGGGGSGRLLLVRGLDFHWSLLGGVELGGAALFSQTDNKEFPIMFVVATPLLLRHHDVTWHNEVEIAPIASFTTLDERLSWGARVGGLIGVSTPRFRQIMPWIGVGLAAEFLLPSAARGAARALKGGVRVGFDYDVSGPTD